MKTLFTSVYAGSITSPNSTLDQRAGWMQKPFSPSKLALKLREVLDRPRSPGKEMAAAAKGANP